LRAVAEVTAHFFGRFSRRVGFHLLEAFQGKAAREKKTKEIFMDDLSFFFMSNPKFYDGSGALRQEKRIYGDKITLVDSAQDLVSDVLPWVKPPKSGMIRKMKISAHGGIGYFYLGDDKIEMTKKGPTPGLTTLGRLAPFFAIGAEVIISACRCAAPDEDTGRSTLLAKLSSMWPGVTVVGYTGKISEWEWWVFYGGTNGGDEVVCVGGQCEINPPRPPYDGWGNRPLRPVILPLVDYARHFTGRRRR
jgi:hypothetical protein